MLWNTILLALRAIRRNLLRSFLTVLGIVIGVAAVITMVTLGNGATRSVTDQISAMGSNLLIVIPGQRFGPGGDNAPRFKIADADAVRAQVSAAITRYFLRETAGCSASSGRALFMTGLKFTKGAPFSALESQTRRDSSVPAMSAAALIISIDAIP